VERLKEKGKRLKVKVERLKEKGKLMEQMRKLEQRKIIA